MRVLLAALAAAAILTGSAHADKGTHLDSIRFIQYLDENTALEEVRNGNLDMYYYTIPSDRLEEYRGDESLRIFDSAGGVYGILANPADTGKFNPFAHRDARYALNYILDRDLIVNELMGGYGTPLVSYYGPSDPEYLTAISEIESFDFEYNPGRARALISGAMEEAGAEMSGGRWHHGGEPVEITMFIRSDDPLRKSIGETLAAELQKVGFGVRKEFGDLNKAFVVVYGSDPAEYRWHLYTEAWGRSTFVRYDPVGLSQMYAPWFSNMPGFNNPAYWNYENAELDEITGRIYSADFGSAEERAGLVRDAVRAGVGESVRVFLAGKTNQYVANAGVDGIVNDFGAGVPGRFTPINARTGGDELVVGVKQIYQGAWNPVMGLTDTYGRHIWGIVNDPGTFGHPFTGQKMPVRSEWSVRTAGPDGALAVPEDAVLWDPGRQEWIPVGPGTEAASAVTYEFEFGNWHHGEPMDINDVLYSAYFASEWGTQDGPEDRTFDTEFTPRAAQALETMKGLRVTGPDTLELYVDYWHFDEGEIAGWVSLWSLVPWEVSAAMEQAVIDGKASYSRSGATSKNVGWLSLLVPNDAALVAGYLEGFSGSGFVPAPLDADAGYAESRYAAALRWIEENNHAVISNGPYYMESYSPESRAITVRAFADETYPFDAGRWSEFENPQIPEITSADVPGSAARGQPLGIAIEAAHADTAMYFVSDGTGSIVESGSIDVSGGSGSIEIPSDATAGLAPGAGSIKVFAVSESVLRPDLYESSFIVTDAGGALPAGEIDYSGDVGGGQDHISYVVIVIAAAAAAAYAVRRRLAHSRAV